MKRNHKAGFTLVETLVSVLILVIMVLATTTGMNTAMRVYKEATFHANSAALDSMLRSTLEDLLSYAQDIEVRTGAYDTERKFLFTNTEGDFLFTNTTREYGVQDVYLCLNPTKYGGSPIQMKRKEDKEARDLINTGAYPKLTVQNSGSTSWIQYGYRNLSDGTITNEYKAGDTTTQKVFAYKFTIVSQIDPTMTREVEGTIFPLNPEKTTEPTT